MICGLKTALPEGRVFRVARAVDPWAWPDWRRSYRGTFGNRWDDPEGTYRVLYASSTRFGAMVETLARFRPDLEVVAGRREIDATDAVTPGVVPLEWFASRRIGVADLSGTYADIGAAASLAVVRARLAVVALDHGLTEIDAAAIRVGMPRAFTQAVSRLVYECRSAEGGQFAGVYYRSRLDDGTSNWAIFEPPPGAPGPLHIAASEPISPASPDVAAALGALGLRVDH